MTLTISSVRISEPLALQNTSIGQLAIFKLNIRSMIKLSNTLGDETSKIKPIDYVRSLITFVCYPMESLIDGKTRPNEPVLSLRDVQKLRDGELEEFAKLYVQNNEYLFKDSSTSTDTAYPRNKDEFYVDYLHRLTVLQEKKLSATVGDVLKPFKNFSNDLAAKMVQNVKAGEQLRRAILGLQDNQQLAQVRSLPLELPKIDYSELSRLEEKRRRAPFEELGVKLDLLIETSNKSVEFIIEANKVQTQIAAELKGASDTGRHYSVVNIALSIAVIILAGISIFTSIYLYKLGERDTRDQQRVIAKYANDISGSLKDIDQQIREGNSRIQSKGIGRLPTKRPRNGTPASRSKN